MRDPGIETYKKVSKLRTANSQSDPCEFVYTRRQFAKRVALGGAAATFLSTSSNCLAAEEAPPFPQPASAIPPPKHIVLILADTLRYDYVGAYGKGKCATPHIDSIARDGILLDNAFTPSPISAPAYASLLSSTYPFQHGVSNNGVHLPTDLPILPGFLKESGFHTAAFVANYYCGPKFSFDRAWDTFFDSSTLTLFSWNLSKTLLPWLASWQPSQMPLFLFLAYMDPHVPYAPPYMPKWLLASLEDRVIGTYCPELSPILTIPLDVPPGEHHLAFDRIVPPLKPDWKPLFRVSTLRQGSIMQKGVAVEFVENVGEPFDARPRLRTKQWPVKDFPLGATVINPTDRTISGDLKVRLVRAYTAQEARFLYPQCIEFMDHEIGKVLDAFRGKGVYDDTLFIFLADHGEGLGDHDLVGHLKQVYDSLMHVPLIFRYAPLGQGRVSSLASLVDVFPTIAALMGAQEAPDQKGRSLLPDFAGHAPRHGTIIVGETSPPEAPERLTSIRTRQWKLIVNATRRTAELYDLTGDPGELKDIFSENEVLSRETVGVYKRLFAINDVFDPITDIDELDLDSLDDAELEELRALGYLE